MHTQALSEKSLREQASYQFRVQSERLGYSILKRLAPYKMQVKDMQDFYSKPMTAVILPTSFDYYTYRLHRSKPFDLLIVQRHNAIVPVDVVDMLSSKRYFPGTNIDDLMRANRKRRNTDEKALLLSQIITGTPAGQTALASMSLRMRQRYLKEAKIYLGGRIGRPFTS